MLPPRLVRPDNHGNEPASLILQLAQPVQVIEAMLERFPEAEHHGSRSAQSQPVRFAMDRQPLRGVDFHRADAGADFIVQNLGSRARNGIQTRIAQPRDGFLKRYSRNSRQINNLRRREAVQPDVEAALDLPQQHLIVLNFQIRVVAALDENAAGASADGILDLGKNFVVGENIALLAPRRAVKRTEGAVGVADICVIHGALDGIRDDLVGMLLIARLGGRHPERRELSPV